MLQIYPIQEKLEYIEEVAILTQKEWGKKNLKEEEFQQKVEKKIEKIKRLLGQSDYCKLLLLEESQLVGFISIFSSDCEERKDLSPWYSTMYVKKEYRGHGYSRLLNDAILKEAKNRNFEKIYLKTELVNYYEKFGAIYLETLEDGEKIYYFELKGKR